MDLGTNRQAIVSIACLSFCHSNFLMSTYLLKAVFGRLDIAMQVPVERLVDLRTD